MLFLERSTDRLIEKQVFRLRRLGADLWACQSGCGTFTGSWSSRSWLEDPFQHATAYFFISKLCPVRVESEELVKLVNCDTSSIFSSLSPVDKEVSLTALSTSVSFPTTELPVERAEQLWELNENLCIHSKSHWYLFFAYFLHKGRFPNIF